MSHESKEDEKQRTMATWSDDKTLKLIELWGEGSIQAQLEGCKRNTQVFEKVARDMKEAGFERTAIQCRDKTKKLRADYRKIKDKHGKTGESRKKWKFLEPMDSILGHKPATCPTVVVDTLGESQQSPSEPTIFGPIDSDEETSASSAIEERAGGEKSAGLSFPPTPKSSVAEPNSSTAGPPPTKKLRKMSKSDKLDKAIGMIDAIVSKQQEETDRLVRLEERRLE